MALRGRCVELYPFIDEKAVVSLSEGLKGGFMLSFETQRKETKLLDWSAIRAIVAIMALLYNVGKDIFNAKKK